MNLTELKRKNSVSIYRCILDGINSTIPIAKTIGLSQLTVCELANEMVAREILDITKPKRNVKGRRIHYFQPSHKFYTAIIDVQKNFICTIGITPSGNVTERFDYPVNYLDKTVQQILSDHVIKKLKNCQSFKYCTSVYVLCDSNDSYDVGEDITVTTKERLIVDAIAHKDKAMLFEFNGKCLVSLYSHVYQPKVSKDELIKAIPFDEFRCYDGDLFEIFIDSIQRIATKRLEDVI